MGMMLHVYLLSELYCKQQQKKHALIYLFHWHIRLWKPYAPPLCYKLASRKELELMYLDFIFSLQKTNL